MGIKQNEAGTKALASPINPRIVETGAVVEWGSHYADFIALALLSCAEVETTRSNLTNYRFLSALSY